MRNRIVTLLVVLALPMACATQPDPAEICTAKWIKPRVDAAMSDFRANTDDIMKSLTDVGEDVAGAGGALGMLDKMKVFVSLGKLMSNFQGGQTLKDLNTLGKTCNDPALAMDSLKGVLDEYDVPPVFIELLENLDDFKALAEDAAGQLQ